MHFNGQSSSCCLFHFSSFFPQKNVIRNIIWILLMFLSTQVITQSCHSCYLSLKSSLTQVCRHGLLKVQYLLRYLIIFNTCKYEDLIPGWQIHLEIAPSQLENLIRSVFHDLLTHHTPKRCKTMNDKQSKRRGISSHWIPLVVSAVKAIQQVRIFETSAVQALLQVWTSESSADKAILQVRKTRRDPADIQHCLS